MHTRHESGSVILAGGKKLLEKKGAKVHCHLWMLYVQYILNLTSAPDQPEINYGETISDVAELHHMPTAHVTRMERTV